MHPKEKFFSMNDKLSQIVMLQLQSYEILPQSIICSRKHIQFGAVNTCLLWSNHYLIRVGNCYIFADSYCSPKRITVPPRSTEIQKSAVFHFEPKCIYWIWKSRIMYVFCNQLVQKHFMIILVLKKPLFSQMWPFFRT